MAKWSTGISGFRKAHIFAEGVNLVQLDKLAGGRGVKFGDLRTKTKGGRISLGVDKPVSKGTGMGTSYPLGQDGSTLYTDDTVSFKDG